MKHWTIWIFALSECVCRSHLSVRRVNVYLFERAWPCHCGYGSDGIWYYVRQDYLDCVCMVNVSVECECIYLSFFRRTECTMDIIFIFTSAWRLAGDKHSTRCRRQHIYMYFRHTVCCCFYLGCHRCGLLTNDSKLRNTKITNRYDQSVPLTTGK